MALVKGTNSYLTVAEADAYFATRFNSPEWSSADSALKETLLITATSEIDKNDFMGRSKSAEQPLAFPREGTYIDPRTKHEASMDPIPKRVLDAVCEFALHLIKNSSALESSAQVKRIQVGSISLEGLFEDVREPMSVKALLSPFTQSGKGRQVWRAW